MVLAPHAAMASSRMSGLPAYRMPVSGSSLFLSNLRVLELTHAAAPAPVAALTAIWAALPADSASSRDSRRLPSQSDTVSNQPLSGAVVMGVFPRDSFWNTRRFMLSSALVVATRSARRIRCARVSPVPLSRM